MKKFKKYDLSHIRSEYLNHNNLTNPTEALPEYSGGTDVDLLLGMKNINVQPTLLQVLPSGIGVYRSVFKDIWGSQIIFAGPHTSFTSTNLGSKEESSLAIFTVGLEMEEKSWKRTREEINQINGNDNTSSGKMAKITENGKSVIIETPIGLNKQQNPGSKEKNEIKKETEEK